MLSSSSRSLLCGRVRASTPDLQRLSPSATVRCAIGGNAGTCVTVGGGGRSNNNITRMISSSLFGGSRVLLARKAGKQTAWSPHTGTASQNATTCSPLEADVLMWSPLPRDQTVEYEEDTGSNITIQREYVGKKSRTDLSIFQNVPLVHSKIELERGRAVIAQAINSKKDPREATRGDDDVDGYTSTDYDPETGSLISARHEFTQDKVQYCHRFCRGIIPVEAVRHSILQLRSSPASSDADNGGGSTTRPREVGDLSDLGPEDLKEVMAMAKAREAAVLGKFTEDPDAVMDAMMQGKNGTKNKKNNDITSDGSSSPDHVLPPLQALMEACAIAASTLRGGSAALNTLVRGRNILKRSSSLAGNSGEEDGPNPGDRLSGADAPYSPEGRLYGLNATSRGAPSMTMGAMDAAMRSDYGAFESYLNNFGLSTSHLELQAEQYHAELNASLATVEKFNAALRSENHIQKQKILVPSTAQDTIRFDDPGTLHYGTVDDEAADAAARSASATSRSPEEIKFWFSTKNRDEVLHQALSADGIANKYPNTVVSDVAPTDTDDTKNSTRSSGVGAGAPTVELAALYAAYIKFATGESPLPYYSSDSSRYNHNDGSAASAQHAAAVDNDGILPAITTYTSVEGSEVGEADALLTRRTIVERLHWRKIIEKCVLEDFHLLTPQDIDAAKNLNSFIEISKLMDHKVGDVVRSIVQHQRQDGGGGSSGSSHRVNASAPMDMTPGNPASRYADKHLSQK